MKYVFGNGSYGCMFDNIQGPYDSLTEAVDAASEMFELGAEQYRQLKRNEYLDLGPGYGADYVEIFTVDADWEAK